MNVIIRGWKAIIKHTGFSVRVIKALMRDNDKPFPVVKIAGVHITTDALVEAWVHDKITSSDKYSGLDEHG